MTKRPSPDDLKNIRELIQAHPGGTHAVFVEGRSHGAWALDGEIILGMIDIIDALTEERDLLKERLGPAGAKMLMELKRENDLFREALIWYRAGVDGKRAHEALALAKPGEDGK